MEKTCQLLKTIFQPYIYIYEINHIDHYENFDFACESFAI